MTALADALVFALVIGLVVGIHELGHLVAARLVGVEVSVFSIGIGPRLFGWRDRRGCDWRVSLLPFGGYARLGHFREATPWKRLVVALAGPAASVALCFLAYVASDAVLGRPGAVPLIAEVLPDGAAAAAGIRPGDRILTVGGDAVGTTWDVRDRVTTSEGRSLPITVERDGTVVSLTAVPATRSVDTPTGRVAFGWLGVAFVSGEQGVARVPLLQAVRFALRDTAFTIRETGHLLGKLAGDVTQTANLSGPIGVASVMVPAMSRGAGAFVHLIGTLSLSIGLLNLLPIPALDGGHIAFALVESAMGGRRIPALAERIVMAGGFAFVFVLMILTTGREALALLGYALG